MSVRFAANMFLLVIQGWLIGTHAAYAAPRNDAGSMAPWHAELAPEVLKNVQQRFRIPPGAIVRTTFIPDVFKIEADRFDVFLDFSEQGVAFGQFGRKWRMNGQDLPDETRRQKRGKWLASVPKSSLLKIDHGGPSVMILTTAVDCKFCARLEGALRDAGISYYAVVGTLSFNPKWQARLRSAICSSNPQKAWLEMMADRIEPAPASCDWPEKLHSDVSYLLGDSGDSTPRAIFPDGVIANGYDQVLEKAKIGKAKGEGI